jgi:hypothetical protein
VAVARLRESGRDTLVELEDEQAKVCYVCVYASMYVCMHICMYV